MVLKSCRHGGGGCQKSEKNADVVYGWFLGCVVKTGHISLLVLLKTVKVCIVSETNAEFQLSQICLKMALFKFPHDFATLKKLQVSQNWGKLKLLQIGLSRTGHISFLTTQDRTPKF